MESFNCSRSLSKCSRSRRNSSSRLTPNMAAALLSFRWSPQEKPGADVEDTDPNNQRPGVSSGTSWRKLSFQKSKYLTNDKRNNNNTEDDEPKPYEPVTIPRFHEVQTNWPGFEHEPVPNWQEKYMLAKPYPRNEEDISRKSSFMNYGNDFTLLSSNDARVGLRNSKSKSKSRASGEVKQSNDNNASNNRPKRIIYLERVEEYLRNAF